MQLSARLLWRFTGTIAVLSCLLFATGFVVALNPHTLAPTKPFAPESAQDQAGQGLSLPADGKLNVVTLGDSLTRGVGDVNGEGYVGMFKQAYEKKHNQPILLTNLAISGSQSFELLDQLKQPQVRKLVSDAHLILFTIGGNDLFKQSGGVADLDKKKLESATQTLSSNFKQILQELRSLNPQATIVYSSLYDPFGDTEARPDTTPPVLDWNHTATEVAATYENVVVVPTFDLFVQKEKAYLYTDHFHPNTEGYTRMAERILQALH